MKSKFQLLDVLFLVARVVLGTFWALKQAKLTCTYNAVKEKLKLQFIY